MKHRYLWRKEREAHHQFKYKSCHVGESPDSDLRPVSPPVYDQGSLGSCTSQALAFAHEFEQMKQGLKDVFTPSRLFIYYGEREIEGTIGEDSGAAISDGILVLQQKGVCDETMWPYDVTKYTIKPEDSCYAMAMRHEAMSVSPINQDRETLRACLAQGYPIICGIQVYDGLESDECMKTGIVPMPHFWQHPLGGHCVALVGWRGPDVIIRNSWGPDAGDRGCFHFSEEYILDPDMASNFYALTLVGDLP
jgi:C1A family cysteine protease